MHTFLSGYTSEIGYIAGSGKVIIYVLRNPRLYFPKPKRIKLRDFLKDTEGSPDLKSFKVESLHEFVISASLSKNS
jgi:hypothetical protein